MGNGSQNGVFKALFWMPRFAPAWFSALLLGLMLLFINELPQNCRLYLLPSLAVYSLGAALVAAIHRLLGIHYESKDHKDNEKPIPLKFKIVLYVFHLLWFGAFVAYNFWKSVL